MEYNITYRQKDKDWQYIISYKVNGKWKQRRKYEFKNMYIEHIKLHMQENTIRLYNMTLNYFKPIYTMEMDKITSSLVLMK